MRIVFHDTIQSLTNQKQNYKLRPDKLVPDMTILRTGKLINNVLILIPCENQI